MQLLCNQSNPCLAAAAAGQVEPEAAAVRLLMAALPAGMCELSVCQSFLLWRRRKGPPQLPASPPLRLVRLEQAIGPSARTSAASAWARALAWQVMLVQAQGRG